MYDFAGYCSMCGSAHTHMNMSNSSEYWVRECNHCGYHEELLNIPENQIRKGKGDK